MKFSIITIRMYYEVYHQQKLYVFSYYIISLFNELINKVSI
jgi:hypothetical protein